MKENTFDEEFGAKMMEIEDCLDWMEKNSSSLKMNQKKVVLKLKEAFEEWEPGYLDFHKQCVEACKDFQ